MAMPRSAVACASILAAGVAVLPSCAAIENSKTSSAEASRAEGPATAVRTEATAAPPSPPPSSTEVPPTGDVSLAIDDRGDLGEILVDSTGRAVYAFSKDPANEPTCYADCADTWLPLLAKGDPTGGVGIDVAAAGTVPRRDGGNQATYKGLPLYQYAGDTTDRDAKGQGLDMFGGEWHVLTKDGRPLA